MLINMMVVQRQMDIYIYIERELGCRERACVEGGVIL